MKYLILLLPIFTYAQCPTYEIGSIGYVEFCLTQEETYNFTNCIGLQQYGTSIAFTVEVQPTYIEVNSDLWYSMCTNCDVWAHLYITDGCTGDQIWNTSNCAGQNLLVNSETNYGGFVTHPSWPGTNWWVELNLPPGNYVMHTGGVGVTGIGANMIGCMDVTIISGMLGLEVVEYQMRTIQGGKQYDYLGRLINTSKLN
jgi:hypothetical protein